jgi:hypothetical protein
LDDRDHYRDHDRHQDRDRDHHRDRIIIIQIGIIMEIGIIVEIADTFVITIAIEITSAIEITNMDAERPFLPRIGCAVAIMQIAEMDSYPSTLEAPSCRCQGTRSRAFSDRISANILSRHRDLGLT